MKKHIFSQELIDLKDKFLEYRKTTLDIGAARIQQLDTAISYLYEYMQEKGIQKIENITYPDTLKFQHYVYKTKQVSTLRSIIFLLQNLQSFCIYLYHSDLIWKNPFEKLKFVTPPELETTEIKRYYSIEELLTRWTNSLKKNEYHIENVRSKLNSVKLFIAYMEKRGIQSVYKLRPDIVKEYKTYLTEYQYRRSADAAAADAPGYTYSAHAQLTHLRYTCQFLVYLHRENLVKYDLSSAMDLVEYSKELNTIYKRSEAYPLRRKHERIPDPEIKQLLDKCLQYKIANGESPRTSALYIRALEKFCVFMREKDIKNLKAVTKRDVMDYQNWLYNQKTIKGGKYAQNTLLSLMIGLRSFFTYLTKYDYLICDPTSAIDMPKEDRGIPHSCMTEREVKILLEKPDTATPMGLRDRAIMETLYSTGVRANELVNTKIVDIDFTQGLLRIDEPKGGKSYQRIVPIGKTACAYVKLYINKVRPYLKKEQSCRSAGALVADKGCIFLSKSGGGLKRGYLSIMIRKYLFHLGIRKKITAHSFRVSCATHMLTHDADIRYVQQQLGHVSIRTTQEYTRLAPKDLKAVHIRCHPRDKKFTEE